MLTPSQAKTPTLQALLRSWSSARFTAAVEAAYLLEVASR
jgi:hypothetical protein